MRVVWKGEAVEEQQLQVGKWTIRQKALVPSAAGPECAQPKGICYRINPAIAYDVGPGAVVEEMSHGHE